MKHLVGKTAKDTDRKEISDRVSELSRTATALTDHNFEEVKPIPYRPFLNQGHLSIGESLLYPSIVVISATGPIHKFIILIRREEDCQRRLDPDRSALPRSCRGSKT